jgi:hypothetical protein
MPFMTWHSGPVGIPGIYLGLRSFTPRSASGCPPGHARFPGAHPAHYPVSGHGGGVMLKAATAGLCAYELGALATGRYPTLTELCGRYRGLGPLLVVALAVHLYRQPATTQEAPLDDRH